MHRYGIGSVFTTPLGNKIVIIGLDDNGTYIISMNNGRTILQNQTEEDIERLRESVE